MGQRTGVAAQRRGVQRSTNKLGSPWLNIDVPLVLVLITLLTFGFLMMHSASWKVSMQISETDSPDYLFIRQLRWLGLGLLALVAFAWVDYHRWRHYSVVFMFAALLALIAVLVFGESYYGKVRSFYQGSYQPSELAKFVLVIYLSVWLYAKRDQLADVSFGLIPLGAIVGVIGGLIMRQPDLSAAGIVVLLGAIMFYLAGSDTRQTLILVLVALTVGYLVLRFNPTGNERVGKFLAGWQDVMNSSHHVAKAMIAFFRGGWFGVGIGRSTTKLTTLPFPHTDSVFAVVGEETGVFGASALVILYGLLFWRGLVIAHKAQDELGSLLAAGLTMWITLEAFVNIASLLNLMPFAGNTLPFFSVGGSNLVSSMAAVGIVLNVSRLSEQKQQEDKRRTFGAIVDLRGRDRRRRVSSSGRTRRFEG
ncbi:MAG: FtsW/RodA/SpoVE family cell cycle protein [Chloroflexota bacterium]|nr:FtsW/RodA/SpoVE family cell cycle protein [Chloroflexota bacterium]